MFNFKVYSSNFINHVTDIATLEDIALGYLDDEKEAKRVSLIAGNMKFDEMFVADSWILTCKREEEKNDPCKC